MRVLVVGAGPKALFCVERLVTRAASGAHQGASPRAAQPAHITVLDPAPPGQGAAYATGRPREWRLNVTSTVVDAAHRTGDAPTTAPIPSLDAWRVARGEAADEESLDRFPTRALVGEYLAEQWATLAAHLPAGVTLDHRRTAATLLERGEGRRDDGAGEGSAGAGNDDGGSAERGRWRVRTEDGEVLEAEHVLLATGHARDWPGALRHDWPMDAPALVGSVYEPGVLESVPDGALVVVRGAALTFIDAALTLTQRDQAQRDQAQREKARPDVAPPSRTEVPATSTAEAPATSRTELLPVSRSGLFMVPKPDPAWTAGLPLQEQRAEAAAWILAHPGDVAGLLARVEEVAGRYLHCTAAPDAAHTTPTKQSATQPAQHKNAAPVRLAQVLAARAATDPVELLAQEVAVAEGSAAPDATWALGQAWRDLYEAIVASVSFEQCDTEQWQRFAEAARALEPIGFGPPLVNARLLLRMLRDGTVHAPVACEDVAQVARDLEGQGGRAVVVLDAVLAPPGITSGLLQRAVEAGLLHRAAGRRGGRVDLDLACLDAQGTPIPGLWAVGRPTEDVILGNDTLKRSLHAGPDRWARRLLRQDAARG